MESHNVEVLFCLLSGRRQERCLRIEFAKNEFEKYGLIWLFEEGKAIGFDFDKEDAEYIDDMIEALKKLKEKLTEEEA